MHSQFDTISWAGFLSHENFRRRQSSCSIHKNCSPTNQEKTLGLSISPHSDCHQSCEAFSSRDGERFNQSFHGYRYIVVFLGGLAVGFMSMLRLNITVAILNMVNQTRIFLEEGDHDEADIESYFGEGYVEVGEFDWDNEIQQLIISYYMIAYALPQLMTTKLAIRIGVRYSIPICVAICALSCILTPVAAYVGWQYVVALRLLNGVGASAILPLMVHLIELWMPQNESAFGLAIVQFVQAIFFTTCPLVSGYLAAIHWKWAFYVPSIGALVSCIIWLCFVTDGPDECRFISQRELDTICACNKNFHGEQKSISDTKEISKKSDQSDHEQLHDDAVEGISWTQTLRFKSFYYLILVWILYQSSFGSLSFLIPIYMRQVLKVPIIENGYLCFVIQCGCMISSLWPQPILRQLEQKFNLSLTQARRVVLVFICLVATVTCLLIAVYHQHQVTYLALNRIFHLSTDTIVTSTIMTQYSKSGFSSTIYSLINAIGSFSTVFFCMAVGKFLDLSGQSIQCWSWVFVSMCIMNVGIALLYAFLIKSEPIEFEKISDIKRGQTKSDKTLVEEGKRY